MRSETIYLLNEAKGGILNTENAQQSRNLTNITDREQLVSTLSDFSETAVSRSKEAMEKSVQVAKDYPVHTAIGAGVLGFVAGIITQKFTR